jgi:hypothetical protein
MAEKQIKGIGNRFSGDRGTRPEEGEGEGVRVPALVNPDF